MNRKLFLIIPLIFIYLISATPVDALVTKGDSASGGDQSYPTLVNSEGFFTSFSEKNQKCGVTEIADVDGFDQGDAPEHDSLGMIYNKINEFTLGITSKLTNFLKDRITDMDKCPGDSVLDKVDEEVTGEEKEKEDTEIGLFEQILVFTKPVNVTHIQSLMHITGILQNISLALIVLAILYFAYQMIAGKQNTMETGAIIRFFLKFVFVMFAVYIAPYLMQDILNLNNTLTFNLGNQIININDNAADGVSRVPVYMSITSIYAMFLNQITGSVDNLGESIIMLFVVIIVVVATVIPIIKMLIWWYTRLFKIFLLTAISPIMLATLASTSTERTGKNFLANFVKTALEQFFVVSGLAVIASFMAEVPQITQDLGLGFIGTGLALYAGLSFVAQIPALATGMMEGVTQGSVDMGNMFRENQKAHRGVRKYGPGVANQARNAGGAAKQGARRASAGAARAGKGAMNRIRRK